MKTLADLLTGYIGIFDSNEFIKGGDQMPVSTGKSLLTFQTAGASGGKPEIHDLTTSEIDMRVVAK